VSTSSGTVAAKASTPNKDRPQLERANPQQGTNRMTLATLAAVSTFVPGQAALQMDGGPDKAVSKDIPAAKP
jgi:hypothetical protein